MALMKFVVYRRVGWTGVEWRCDNDITPSTLTPQQVYPVPFIEWCKLGTGQWEGAHPADMQRRLISLLSFGMEVKLPYGTAGCLYLLLPIQILKKSTDLYEIWHQFDVI